MSQKHAVASLHTLVASSTTATTPYTQILQDLIFADNQNPGDYIFGIISDQPLCSICAL